MASKAAKTQRKAERRAQRRLRRLQTWSANERSRRMQEDPAHQAAFDDLVQSVLRNGIDRPVEVRPKYTLHVQGIPYVVDSDVEMPGKALRAALLGSDISAATELLTPLLRALQHRLEVTKRVTLLAVKLAVDGIQLVVDNADEPDPETRAPIGRNEGSN